MKALDATEFADAIKSAHHGIRPSAHMTAGEAAFLIGTMPDNVVETLRKAPRFRMPNEPADAWLIRSRLQRALKVNDTFTKK